MESMEITLTCDRCKKEIKGSKSHTTTEGYYDVREGYWSRFARRGEESVCDWCMWEDAKYVALYGKQGVG